MNLSSAVELSPKNLQERIPVVLTTPNSGSGIPEDLQPYMSAEYRYMQPDSDWMLHRFWEFSTTLGATLVFPFFSPYVVNLVHDPKDPKDLNKALPKVTSQGNEIYVQDMDFAAETTARLELYYDPFHQRLAKVLDQVKRQFGYVVMIESFLIKDSADIVLREPNNSSQYEKFQDVKRSLQASYPEVKIKKFDHPSKLAEIYQRVSDKYFTFQIFVGEKLFLSHGQFFDRNAARPTQEALEVFFKDFL